MAEQKTKIIVNGEEYEWPHRIITKIEVGKLAYKNHDWYKSLLEKAPIKISQILSSMSATYKNAHWDNNKHEGIMGQAESVRIKDGTVFNIYDTSNA